MRLIVQPFSVFKFSLLGRCLRNLLLNVLEVIHSIIFVQNLFMSSDKILLIFVLFKLFSFEFSDLLDVCEFTLESLLSLGVIVLDICDILNSFSFMMVVNLEWAITSQEWWISLCVIFFRDDVPVESIAYQFPNRGSLGCSKVRLRREHLLSLTCGTGIVLSSHCTILSSVVSNWVTKCSIIAVFNHLLETLRVCAVMDQRFELVWFYVLDS